MNEWSLHRKRIILGIVSSVLIVLIGVPLFFFFYKPASCTDGKQNGDETGIDCGGGCKLLCQADYLPILLKGDPQIIRVSTTTSAVIIEAENPNINGEIPRAGYTIKLYEASSTIPLKIIEGTTFVPKSSKFAIFIGPLTFGESTPYRVVFEWDQNTLVWNKNTNEVPLLTVENKALDTRTIEPRLTAELRNQSLQKVSNVELTALISDASGNIIGTSKTLVDSIDKGSSEPLIFTWPAPFEKTPTSVEVLIKILPDKSFI